jgi:hypothetical protein
MAISAICRDRHSRITSNASCPGPQPVLSPLLGASCCAGLVVTTARTVF